MGSRVSILLGTLNGQSFLSEQLDSINRQVHASWSIWASDDGSTDGTWAILQRYRRWMGKDKLSIIRGPGQGYIKNFLSLACNPAIQSDYYAFADQDDIWQPDKLSRALAWLQTISVGVPALYCARTLNVDDANQAIGMSPLFTKPPSFANALVQNIGGGNTMVFNHAACELLRKAGADVQVASHDWWTYLVVSGCGGLVHYDPTPTLRYRQHAGNLVGSNGSWIARCRRFTMMLGGRFKDWTQKNTLALTALKDQLSQESDSRLLEFQQSQHGNIFARLKGVKRSGIYRQTLIGNLGLISAVLLNKI